MDLVGVNANLNALGVVTPESGTGIHNTYYIQRGSTAFRKINGICFLYFDITIISTNTEDTILITNLFYVCVSLCGKCRYRLSYYFLHLWKRAKVWCWGSWTVFWIYCVPCYLIMIWRYGKYRLPEAVPAV